MADDFILDRVSDMDSYDREERCRKTMRTLLRAILARMVAGTLLTVAVIRSGRSWVALGLTGFALLLILSGLIPLCMEWNKQRALLKDCLAEQENTE